MSLSVLPTLSQSFHCIPGADTSCATFSTRRPGYLIFVPVQCTPSPGYIAVVAVLALDAVVAVLARFWLSSRLSRALGVSGFPMLCLREKLLSLLLLALFVVEAMVRADCYGYYLVSSSSTCYLFRFSSRVQSTACLRSF